MKKSITFLLLFYSFWGLSQTTQQLETINTFINNNKCDEAEKVLLEFDYVNSTNKALPLILKNLAGCVANPEKAIEIAQKALELNQKQENNQPNELQARILQNIGVYYNENKNSEIAIDYYIKALEIGKSIRNFPQKLLIMFYKNIIDAQSRSSTDNSIKMVDSLLALVKAECKPKSEDYYTNYLYVLKVYIEQNDLQKAKIILDELYIYLRNTYPVKDEHFFEFLLQKYIYFFLKQDFSEAENVIVECLNILENGDNRIVMLHYQQASLKAFQGEIEDAEYLLKKILNEIDSNSPESFSTLLLVYNMLGYLYENQKEDIVGAEEYYSKALKIAKELNFNKETIELYLSLVRINERLGRIAKAEQILNIANITIENKKKEIEKIYEIFTQIGNYYIFKSQPDLKKAEENYNKALNYIVQHQGKMNFIYRNTYKLLANLYMKQGRYDLQLICIEECLKITQELVGINSLDYAELLLQLAYYYKDANSEKFNEIMRLTLSIEQNILGRDNVNLIPSLIGLEYYDEAIEILESKNLIYNFQYLYALQQKSSKLARQKKVNEANQSYLKYIKILNNKIIFTVMNLSEINKIGILDKTLFSLNGIKLNQYIHSILNPNINFVTQIYNSELIFKGLLASTGTLVRKQIMASNNKLIIEKLSRFIEQRKNIDNYLQKSINEHPINFKEILVENEKLESELIKESQMFEKVSNYWKIAINDIGQRLNDSDVAIEFVSFILVRNRIENFGHENLE